MPKFKKKKIQKKAKKSLALAFSFLHKYGNAGRTAFTAKKS